MDRTTLCYIEKDGKYLMLYRNKKENDINNGKWLGVGGHIKEGETPEECIVREIKEETGLTALDVKAAGTVKFISPEYSEIMYLFGCERFEGELIPCDEGKLEWIEKEKILKLPLWEGDKIFLKKLFSNERGFELSLFYEGDKLIRFEEKNISD